VNSYLAVQALPLAKELDENKVTPGLLGFVVFAALAVAVWRLVKSMNHHMGKVDFPEEPGAEGDVGERGAAERAAAEQAGAEQAGAERGATAERATAERATAEQGAAAERGAGRDEQEPPAQRS
jgi:hypothetical protein